MCTFIYGFVSFTDYVSNKNYIFFEQSVIKKKKLWTCFHARSFLGCYSNELPRIFINKINYTKTILNSSSSFFKLNFIESDFKMYYVNLNLHNNLPTPYNT
jgi:hypothetical protein